MKIIHFIAFLLFWPSFVKAQTSATTDRTQVALVQTDSTQTNNKQDSTVLISKAKTMAIQIASDSLGNPIEVPLAPDSTLINQVANEAKQQAANQLDINLPTDSASLVNQAEQMAISTLHEEVDINISGIPTDSAAIKSTAKNLAKDELSDQLGVEVPDITLDSTTADQVKKEAERRAEAAIKNTDEFKAFEDNELSALTDDLDLDPEQLRQMEAKQEMKKKMATMAKDYITENTEKIQQVQSQMSNLKQKYSTVPNSNDLSSATKRSSLKGEPLSKRLVIGGNLSLAGTDPIILDLSPVLGYKWNKLFESGVTSTFQTQFGSSSRSANAVETSTVFGYGIYANHMVFKNFFAYLEGGRISKVEQKDDVSERIWDETLQLGIGRKFKIAQFLEMQAIVTYNFLHDNTTGIYNSPISFKTGFRVVK